MDARLIVAAAAFFAAPVFSQSFDPAHQAWDGLLRKHVVVLDAGRASQLGYAGMARDRAALQSYLDGLSAVGEREFNGWTKPQQMAFLINAYNAFMVQKVLARYPDIGSIWDFGKVFGNPFKERFFSLFGRPFSLDVIEHDMLRKSYAEPRVHYALNCASVGCPMLREEAYVAARLERQLEEQATRFLSDRLRNRMRDGRLEVSKIFDWYREDFAPRERYFARYAKLLADRQADQELLLQAKAPISFLDYDWSLNDFRSSSRR